MTDTPSASPAPVVFAPGTRVRVTIQVPRQEQALASTVEGVVVRQEQKPSGSWFAHGKNDKVWLDRLVVRKDDGEIYVCNLDGLTRVETV